MNKSITKIIIVIIALLITAGLFYFVIIKNHDAVIINDDNDNFDYHVVEYKGERYKYNTNLIPILLMGVDTKEGIDGQSDHISLFIIDRENKEYKILAVPRETITEIEVYGEDGEYLGLDDNFLGLAYPNGMNANKGAIVAMEATSKLLHHIPIIYYAVSNMNILPEMAEIAGDVDIELEDDSLAYRNPEWIKGYVYNVNPDTIETFLRSRDTSADFTNRERMGRQNLYLNWFFDNIKYINEKDSSFLLDKLSEILDDCDTNISYNEAESLFELVNNSTRSDPFIYQIEGRYASGEFYDEFYPNEDSLEALVIKLFYIKES